MPPDLPGSGPFLVMRSGGSGKWPDLAAAVTRSTSRMSVPCTSTHSHISSNRERDRTPNCTMNEFMSVLSIGSRRLLVTIVARRAL